MRCSKGKSGLRGVHFVRARGVWEAHAWDTEAPGMSRKRGKQVYLGTHQTCKDAARAHDLMVIRLKGLSEAHTNFNLITYMADVPFLLTLTIEECSKLVRLPEKYAARLEGFLRREEDSCEVLLWEAEGARMTSFV